MSTNSVLITATIYAHEGINFRICNIPVAFISEYMDKEIKMELHGRLSELMVNIATQIYRQHVIHEKGGAVLYVTLNKALYGCLILVLLLY